MKQGKIVKVSGPLVVAESVPDAKIYDVVRVGKPGLVGEIIELKEEFSSIQVYEETGGIGPGEPVVSTGMPLSVELGPGLMETIFDGTQRPLDLIRAQTGDFVTRGIALPPLDRNKKWGFKPQAKTGEKVTTGDVLGIVDETPLVEHKIMVPPGIGGEIVSIKEGEFTIEEPIAEIKTRINANEGREYSRISVKMLQRWPVRQERPYQKKLPPDTPLVTGQRVIDTLFPVAKGGTACVPGPFGSGKTVIQHQLSKWADADIIVFIGCGERGNEMASVLLEFPELKDPRSGRPLTERTVLIANTSNMPVAAREASVYTGITIAEYFRDMGYTVALMADSTSRWAEALREISSRLEEMPGEEGYPAYLATRLAAFYERSGRVICLGSKQKEGALSVIGAVSPPGGDLSDPVVQGTLRMVKVFWSLEDKLAYQRHFPAISWLRSYSLYLKDIEEFSRQKIGKDWVALYKEAIKILQEEASLEEIVRLVGLEAISDEEKLILETARSIREDYLQQNAFDPADTYCSLTKQYQMLKIIIELHHQSEKALKSGIEFEKISRLPVKVKIAKMKYVPEAQFEQFGQIYQEMLEQSRTIQ